MGDCSNFFISDYGSAYGCRKEAQLPLPATKLRTFLLVYTPLKAAGSPSVDGDGGISEYVSYQIPNQQYPRSKRGAVFFAATVPETSARM